MTRAAADTVEKPVVSGWCSSPAGARPKHTSCQWDLCQCRCHKEGEACRT